MANNRSRRRVLRAVSVGVGGTLAGCSGLNSFECPDRNAVVIEVKAVTNTPENPLQVNELPVDQQPFLQEAIESGEFRACPYDEVENEQALDALASTSVKRADISEDGTVYLEYQGEYYAITTFLIEDQAYG